MNTDKVIIVWDGFGSLMAVGQVETRGQANLFLSDLCEEWFEHCRGDVVLTDNEWDFLCNNTRDNVSINVLTGADDEIEITTRTLREYSHYAM